jgi:hypothetical protein
MTSEQRPIVYSGHYFWVPRVVVVHKFDCVLKYMYVPSVCPEDFLIDFVANLFPVLILFLSKLVRCLVIQHYNE